MNNFHRLLTESKVKKIKANKKLFPRADLQVGPFDNQEDAQNFQRTKLDKFLKLDKPGRGEMFPAWSSYIADDRDMSGLPGDRPPQGSGEKVWIVVELPRK